jgi:hypothetical protein
LAKALRIYQSQQVWQVAFQNASTQIGPDRYAEAVAHALRRKKAFNKKVFAQKLGEVTFSKGQLVQIYRSNLDYTFKTEHKLLPKWSIPQQITS